MPARTSPARQSLIDATADLTYERGITATGVDLIAQRAGVTKRTLYQHFPSKDELVAAALDARSAMVLEMLRRGAHTRATRTGDPPVLALFDRLERFLAGPGAPGCAFLNAALELGNPEHPARRAAERHFAARDELVAELLRESGVDDPGLAAEIAVLVVGAYAAGGSRRDPSAAVRAKRVARMLIDQPRGTA